MRIAFMLLAVFPACLVAASCSRHSEQVTARAEANQVRLAAFDSEPFADLGSVPIDQLAERSVHVRNVAPYPIRVRVARVSCSCVDVSLERELLGVGEACTLTYATIAAGTYQRQTQTVELEAYAPEQADAPSQRLHTGMTYQPELEFYVHPTQVVITGQVGETLERRIVVRRYSLPELVVEGGVSSLPGVNVSIAPVGAADEDATAVVLECNLTEAGLQQGHIEIRTSSARFERVRIPITIRAWPAWTVSPPAITMILPPAREPVRRTILAEAPAASEQRLESVALVGATNGISVDWNTTEAGASPRYEIEVSIA
jgi:hypothetical protein